MRDHESRTDADLNSEPDDRMEFYFDNLLPEDQAQEFLAEAGNDPVFESARALQLQIDDSLRRTFSRAENMPLDLSAVPATRCSRGHGLRIAIAASLLFVLAAVAWQWRPFASDEPFYQSKALAAIYRQTVEAGFVPYYECDDMQRFADTFEHRQGVRVALAEMPPDRGMLGLSYLGGLSRHSTSMLGQVHGTPVLVFIDVTANDRPGSSIIAAQDGLNVFRRQANGLVLYEVSPLEQPQLLTYFIFP
jgi:hypothetical protein